MHGEARTWFRGAWFCLGLLVAVAAWVMPRCVVLCTGSLVRAPEPPEGADWREWPLADPGATCRGVCPGGDVSRDGWDRATGPDPSVLWLRHDDKSGVFVVGGAPRADEAPHERFVTGFRREGGQRLAFTSGRAAASAFILALAVAVLVVGLGAARRRVRAAGEIAESSREAHLSLSSNPPSYRRAPTTRALVASEGTFEARSAEGARLAIRALRASLLAVGGLFVLFVACAGGVMFREWMRILF